MFTYEGNTYQTYAEIASAVMSAHPEILDDDLSDYIDSHVEEDSPIVTCEFCGTRTSDYTHHILLRHPEEQ